MRKSSRFDTSPCAAILTLIATVVRFRADRSSWLNSLALIAVAMVCTALATLATAEDADTEAGKDATVRTSAKPVDFARQVLPILSNKCFLCHGPDVRDEEAVRLDSFAGATVDLGGYRAIDPEDPESSELLARILSADDPMPPEDAEKPLTSTEKGILSQWIRQGGSYEKHWAFVPPQKVDPPAADGPNSELNDSELNTIDRFVLAGLREKGLGFAEQADPPTLARRLALVLTGLPPEPAQLERFISSDSVDAYDQLIDSLFSSQRFGEHQARYWLDAVRYGDTHGLHLDNRRGIYPYRDWVVRAFNQNLPLDQFITWQLAGDLLPSPTIEQRVATGYVRLNPSTSEGGALPEEFQVKNNFDRTETFGTVFLGMSLNCARCHTHKYDPIPHEEYYGLLAFFNSTAEPAMDGNSYTYGPVLKVPADQVAWDRWDQLRRQRAEILAQASEHLSRLPQKDDAQAAWDGLSVDEQLAEVAAANGDEFDAQVIELAKHVQTEMAAARETFTTTLVAEELEQPRPTHLLRRGEYNLPVGEPLEPGVLGVMGELAAETPRNRLGLAQWLTSREHPLLARVLVNQLWQRVFGEGLVRTPEDFGLQGDQPTHPELLDWLAVELQESGWDQQHMLRLMVQSRTFRQSSAWRSGLDDPPNRLLARGPSYRLDAEVIRDIGLWASDLLNPQMGGEGVKPYQPDGMWLAMAHPASNTKQYVRDEGERLYRRSLYVYWKRTSPHPMMTLFDVPSREASCVRRSRSNTSLQSLGLLNETQRVEMARRLAERLLRQEQDDSKRINRLFKWLACRDATKIEYSACEQLLEAMRARYADSTDDASRLLSIGDAQRNTSLSVVEHAAWTQVCATVLASDVSILLY